MTINPHGSGQGIRDLTWAVLPSSLMLERERMSIIVARLCDPALDIVTKDGTYTLAMSFEDAIHAVFGEEVSYEEIRDTWQALRDYYMVRVVAMNTFRLIPDGLARDLIATFSN